VTDLLSNFEPEIDSVTLVPSDGGVFEVEVNHQLVFSKLQLHRHAEPGEVVELVKKYWEKNT
jgi:selenoprotein W-related protein